MAEQKKLNRGNNLRGALLTLAGLVATITPQATAQTIAPTNQEQMGTGIFVETTLHADQVYVFEARIIQKYLNQDSFDAVKWIWNFGDGTPPVVRTGWRTYYQGGPNNGGPEIPPGERKKNADAYHKFPGDGAFNVVVQVFDSNNNEMTGRTTAVATYQAEDRIDAVPVDRNHYLVSIDPTNMAAPLAKSTLIVKIQTTPLDAEPVCGYGYERDSCDLSLPIELSSRNTGKIPGVYKLSSVSVGSDMFGLKFYEDGFTPSTPLEQILSKNEITIIIPELGTSCLETDGGKNSSLAGRVLLGKSELEDKCGTQYRTDLNTLFETSCDAMGNARIDAISCQYGCSLGACLPKPKTK